MTAEEIRRANTVAAKMYKPGSTGLSRAVNAVKKQAEAKMAEIIDQEIKKITE